MTRARVTIGMPVWNGENYLSAAIESILQQTYPDFALVISDNGSTDRTQQICEDYAARDSRIRYERSDRNRGAAWNYNRVFEGCETEYFKWAAHDDYLAPQFLERCVDVLDSDPDTAVCFTDTVIVDGDGSVISALDYDLDLTSDDRLTRWRSFQDYFSQLRNFHCNPVFALIRTDVLRKTRLIGPYWASDVVLLGELALLGKFHHVREELFYRREHDARAMTANRTTKSLAEWYDTDDHRPSLFPRWRCFFEHAKSLSRFRMKTGERIGGIMSLMRSTRWRGMAKDLRTARARSRASNADSLPASAR